MTFVKQCSLCGSETAEWYKHCSSIHPLWINNLIQVTSTSNPTAMNIVFTDCVESDLSPDFTIMEKQTMSMINCCDTSPVMEVCLYSVNSLAWHSLLMCNWNLTVGNEDVLLKYGIDFTSHLSPFCSFVQTWSIVYSQGHTVLSRKLLTLKIPNCNTIFYYFPYQELVLLHSTLMSVGKRRWGREFESVRIFNSHQLIVLMTFVLNNALCVGVRQLKDTNIVQVTTLYESTLWIPLTSTSNPTAINIVFTDCVASVHVYLIVNITTKA